ncbi:polysaccharide deacetylase family protein [Aquiflexum gelatinilyticum]|uniref:polysaccharide deacetylase family protein n=1 Tax=Aquiflexum gelatinilyticum TaxID=2961943 RepID=UPI0021687211|nr:polysaccharide deacetylase family protein [Aquiflexum gelatinilyticum]MCS4432858.1 polysaccharide deacetylase family protein [Aquiflexum gelatinilyticum]
MDLIFNKKVIDDKYVVLTFDDGCEKFYSITYPILEKFGFPSMIYPVAGYLGKQAEWGGKKLPHLKILSKSMLCELNKLGVEVGAHTMDHVRLTQINRKESFYQLNECKDVLEQLLGKEIISFSYPHGDFNQETIDILKETGFLNALTCMSNYAQEAKSVYEIPRKYITYFDDIDGFRIKLN